MFFSEKIMGCLKRTLQNNPTIEYSFCGLVNKQNVPSSIDCYTSRLDSFEKFAPCKCQFCSTYTNMFDAARRMLLEIDLALATKTELVIPVQLYNRAKTLIHILLKETNELCYLTFTHDIYLEAGCKLCEASASDIIGLLKFIISQESKKE